MQADICHAYQVLKNGGLKDENIVVFMYDDIANNEENPRPGTIINRPEGGDVYAGVPKVFLCHYLLSFVGKWWDSISHSWSYSLQDYVGEEVTVDNFFAVLLGDKTALTGGTGKVVDSGPNDHIFIFYSDHGGPGVLGWCFPLKSNKIFLAYMLQNLTAS